MSGTRDDVKALGHLAMQSSRIEPLRNRMEKFVSEHDEETDLKMLRERTATGASLSDLVDDGRRDRID